jgi:hypothetical protein
VPPSKVTTTTATTAPSKPLNGPTAPHRSLTASERRFVSTADAVCRRLDAELKPVIPKGLEVKEIASLAPRGARLERAATTELARLVPPAGLSRDWRKIMSYREMLESDLANAGSAAKSGNVPAVAFALNSKLTPHRLLLAVATRDGFGYCKTVE